MVSKILVYAGPGTGKDSVKYTLSAFKKLAPKASVEKISPAQLLSGKWTKDTDILIMPGGADIPYVKKLNGKGNQIIRNFVEDGGTYIGICAGSYYASAKIEFAEGNPDLEVIGERELNFFPGTARGPVFEGFEYDSYAGAKIIKIKWANGKAHEVFYNGGGHFVNASKTPNVEVIATYDLPDHPAAIIKCKVGKGKAILSAVHFEYNPCDFPTL